MNENKKLPKISVLGIGFGEVAYQVIMAMQSLLLVYFLYNYSGIPGTYIAAIILIAGTWDAVNDPMMGMIADRTNSKMGKSRPYILFGSFPLALCVLALFFIPESMSVIGKTIWVGVAYVGYVTFRTVVSVPFANMLVRVTDDRDDRMRITRTKTMMGTVGGIVVTLGFSVFAQGKPNEGLMIGVLVAVFTAFYVFSNVFLFATTKELKRPTDSIKVNPLSGVKAVVTNKYWLLLTLCCMAYGVQQCIKSATMVFYLTAKFKSGWLLTPITLMSLAIALTCAMTARIVERKIGLRKVALIGASVAVVGGALRIITMDSSLVVYVLSVALVQAGFAWFFITIPPFIGDVIDYGELVKGVRVEALTSSARTFADKMATTVITSAIAFMLEVSGYIKASAGVSAADIVQPASALNMLFILSAIVPILMAIAVIFIMLKFKVREEIDEMRAKKEQEV